MTKEKEEEDEEGKKSVSTIVVRRGAYLLCMRACVDGWSDAFYVSIR